MPLCPECNAEVAENTKFCTECGAPMPENKSAETVIKEDNAETKKQTPAQSDTPAQKQPVLTLEPPTFDQPPQAPVFEPSASPKPNPVIEQPAPPPTRTAPPNNNPAAEQPPPYGSRYAVMGVGSYIGSTIIINIPVIGWLICIIWAFAAKNQNKRNYMRMVLIFWIIFLVFVAVTSFLTVWFVNQFGGDITQWFEDLINSINML